MYIQDYMSKSLHLVIEDIYFLLKEEKELSIRQISVKTGSQWITIRKAINSMKRLNLVIDKLVNKPRRTRLVSLKS